MGILSKNLNKGGGREYSCELLIYTVFFLTANIADWIVALLNGKEISNYSGVVLFIFLFIIGCIGFVVQRGKINLYYIIERIDIIPLVMLMLLALIRLAIPDISLDTLNYHLFWEEHFGDDIVNYHFFPTRVINSLFFCLGDRTFYIFRMLLGYRGGTLLGTFALMIMYLQGKFLLQRAYVVIIGKKPDKLRNLLIAVVSFLCVAVEQILIYIDTYYVDWLAIPFLIEVVIRILFADRQENIDVCILGIMAGICVCIKPSNAVFIMLLLPFYILKFYRNIRWISWMCGVLGGGLICCPYMYLSYKITGSPVFPYLNKIFKSEWFYLKGVDEYSGMKSLFGPSSVREFLFWPYYMTFQSENIYFADVRKYCGRLLIALIICFISIIIWLLNKQIFLLKINIIFVGAYILYLTCINGHLRYALFLEWYAGIVLGVFGIYILSINRAVIYKIFCIIIICLPTFFTVKFIGGYVFNSNGLVSRQSFFENKDNWLQNAQYLFHDHEPEDIMLDDLAGFIVFDTNASMMSMLNVDAPIINIRSGALTEEGKKKCESILQDISGNGKIYSLSRPNGLEQLVTEINNQGFSIVSVKTMKIPTMVSTNQYCYLVSVEKGKSKTLVYSGENLSEVIVDDSSLAGKCLKIYVGRKWSGMCDLDTRLNVYVNESEEMVNFALDWNGDCYLYELQLPDTINREVKIKVESDSLMNKWMIVQY